MVWVIDDVMTAGTAVGEVADLLAQNGATLAGIVIALDRQEKLGENDNQSAVQAVQKRFGVPVLSLLDLSDIMAYLDGEKRTADLAKMAAYRQKFGC